MTQFSDAALLRGDYAHMAAQLRAGDRVAPKTSEWEKVACDNSAEAAAQEVAKHIFALQESIDDKTERLEIMAFTAAGPMKVLALVPGEGDVLRLDGMLGNGDPVAQVIHASQIALTFVKASLNDENEDDDGLKIGFLIFDDLEKKRKERDAMIRGLSLKTSRTIKPAAEKRNAGKTGMKKTPKKKS